MAPGPLVLAAEGTGGEHEVTRIGRKKSCSSNVPRVESCNKSKCTTCDLYRCTIVHKLGDTKEEEGDCDEGTSVSSRAGKRSLGDGVDDRWRRNVVENTDEE